MTNWKEDICISNFCETLSISRKVTMPKPKSDQARLDIKHVFTFCHFLFLLTTTPTRKFPRIVQTRSGIDNPVMTKVNTSICKENTATLWIYRRFNGKTWPFSSLRKNWIKSHFLEVYVDKIKVFLIICIRDNCNSPLVKQSCTNFN